MERNKGKTIKSSLCICCRTCSCIVVDEHRLSKESWWGEVITCSEYLIVRIGGASGKGNTEIVTLVDGHRGIHAEFQRG